MHGRKEGKKESEKESKGGRKEKNERKEKEESKEGWREGKEGQHVVYTHNGILFSHKKQEILVCATGINLGNIMLSEGGQTHMEKYSRFHLSEVHVQKQKTEWWSPGAGE